MISIIVPVYNVDFYLKRCVDSLISQDYGNYEIILVDDGSTDTSPLICDEYEKKYDNIRVIHQENKGLSEARNIGIQCAIGDWLMFVDSDDYVESNFCSTAIDYSLRYNADICVFGFNKVFENQEFINFNDFQTNGLLSKEDSFFMLTKESVGNYAWNKIYKKYLFDEILYPVNRKWEDIGTTWKLFEKAENICFCSNMILYHYFQRNSSIINTISRQGYIDIFEQEYEEYCFLENKYVKAADSLLSNFSNFCFLFCILFCQDSNQLENYSKAKRIVKKGKIENQTVLYRIFTISEVLFKLICKVSRKCIKG